MKLSEPGKIGTLTLKNRIVMAPMFCMGMTSPSGQLGYSQRGIDYYAARAKGGTRLIITGITCPNEKVEKSWGYSLVNDTSAILWLSELAEAVHDYGAKVYPCTPWNILEWRRYWLHIRCQYPCPRRRRRI